MKFLSNFQQELISQTSIVHYIEYQFEKELKNVSNIVDIKIPENLYDDNTDVMKKLISKCDKALEIINESYLPDRPIPNIMKNVDMREPTGEVINYCVEVLQCGETLNVEELKKELEETNKLNGENYYSFTDEEIEEMIASAQVIFDNSRNNELHEQEASIEALKTSINLVDNKSSSNIFRQSFINIFSIFDAYIFESLKLYFCKKPQELENFLEIKNNDKVKVNIEDVLLFENIDELKESMIHKQFDGKYLSEIIRKLKKFNSALFSEIDYPALMEMIERRNIHLHNKGFADSKYCTSFNIYKFNIGDYVYIDSEYLFIKVFNTLSQFATNFEKVFNI